MSEWIIPATVARRDRIGDPWLQQIADAGLSPEPFEPARATEDSPAGPNELERSYVPSAEEYMRSVDAAVERIRDGDLKKVVLARAMDVRAGKPFDPRKLLIRLRAIEPSWPSPASRCQFGKARSPDCFSSEQSWPCKPPAPVAIHGL